MYNPTCLSIRTTPTSSHNSNRIEMSNQKRGNARTVGGDSTSSMGPGRLTGIGGAMIMKSVSLFLTNGRRASKSKANLNLRVSRGAANMTSDSPPGLETTTNRPRRRRSNAIEDSSGKINPKLLETYKKKTHFSK